MTRDAEGISMLFGKRIGQAQLSDGQKILLQFCMALYARETNLDELVIFMDEPENHLHPAILLEVIDRIIENIPHGQLWIATHSVNILAHFDSTSLQYVHDGAVSFEGNVPTHVLQGLLGNDEEIFKLQHFISLPEQYTLQRYAYQCLNNPSVIFNGREDPQNKQIIELFEKVRSNASLLRVLDIGIGKARLINAIDELDRMSGLQTSEWLDYFGYDITDKFQDAIEKILSRVISQRL